MPFEARRFFFKTSQWKLLFPRNVIDSLISAPTAQAPSAGSRGADRIKAEKRWDWETKQAAANGLARLPGPEDLPVIVAARMSLSFPLLISAIPLYTIDRHDTANQEAAKNFEHPEAKLTFSQVWFTDGGFCSNFPVDLFDSALPRHPTFAINLGKFPEGEEPHPDDPSQDVNWATSNSSHLLPQFSEIPTSGVGAVAGFASAAFNTARNWHDTSYLNQPGHRDRIVRVNQTKLEGGLNLHMSERTITELANRGEAAAQAIYNQFNKPQEAYNNATGWDNHRWVRYRALLSVLPDWLRTFEAGYAVLNLDPAHLPSYLFTNEDCEALAEELTGHLRTMATSIDNAAAHGDNIVNGLTDQPNPPSLLRRIPTI